MSDFNQDYWKRMYQAFGIVEKKKKKPYDPMETLSRLKPYVMTSPGWEEETAKLGKAAPYTGAPVSQWLPEDTVSAFKASIAMADDPVEMEARLNSAYQLSQMKRIPFDEAFRDFDSIMEVEYGKALGPKTWYDAVGNAYKAAAVGTEISKTAYQLWYKGYTKRSDIESDPLYARIMELEDQMPSQDVIKRNIGTRALKAFAQFLPSQIETMKAGAVGGAAGALAGAGMAAASGLGGAALSTAIGSALTIGTGGLGALVIPAIAIVGSQLGGAVGATAVSRELETGSAFYDMLRFQDSAGNKINPQVALIVSGIYGGLAAASEMIEAENFFSAFNGLRLPQQKSLADAAKAAFQSPVDAASRSGAILRTIQTAALRLQDSAIGRAKDITGNVLQETLQEAMNLVADQTARSITNRVDSVNIDPVTLKEITDRISDTIVQSTLGFTAMHAIPASVNLFTEGGKAAKQTSTERMVQTRGEMSAGRTQKGPSLPDASKPMTTTEGFTLDPDEVERFSASIAQPLPKGIRFQATPLAAEENESILKVGTGDKRLGFVRYAFSEATEPGSQSPGIVTVKEFETDTPANLRVALVRTLSARFPGWDIQMEAPGKRDAAIAQWMTDQNPRGKSAGMAWYGAPQEQAAAASVASVRTQIAKALPTWGEEELDVSAKVLSLWGSRMGMTGDEFASKALAPQSVVSGLIPEGIQATGATSRIQSLSGMQNVVEFARNANPSTALHEFTHVAVNFARANKEIPAVASFLSEIETAMGVMDGNWDTPFEGWTGEYRGTNRSYMEALSYGLEDYMTFGKAPTPELETIFQKVGRWIMDIYKGLTSARVEMSPQMQEYFDGLMKSSPWATAPTESQLMTELVAGEKSLTGLQSVAPAMTSAITPEKPRTPEPEAIAVIRGSLRDLQEAKKLAELDADMDDIEGETGWRLSGGEWIRTAQTQASPEVSRPEVMKKASSETDSIRTPLEETDAGPAFEKLYPDPDMSFERADVIDSDPYFQGKENTDTPEFKAWFGESKIIAEGGKPLVVYHGTNVKFDEFQESRQGQAGRGIYMTPFNGNAMEYGRTVMPLYVSMQNPRRIQRRDIPMDVKSFRSNTEGLGYDGIIIESAQGTIDEIIAFSPTQIKSVNNRGSWNPSDPRILFQAAEKTDSPEFKTWFEGSKATDSKGLPLVVYHGTNATIEAFDRTFSKNGPSKFGFFFTDSEEFSDFFGDQHYPSYLSVKNPFVISGSKWDSIREKHAKDSAWFETWRDQLIEKGHDGLFVQGSVEKFAGEEVRNPGIYAVFSPTQVKSINNTGTWDPADPRILYQADQREAILSTNAALQSNSILEPAREALRLAAVQAASKGEGWEVFMNKIEAELDPWDLAMLGVEDLPQDQKTEWYKRVYDQSQLEMSRPDDLKSWISTLAKDGYAQLRKFFDALSREVYDFQRTYPPYDFSDAEELADWTRKRDEADQIQKEVAEPIKAGALSVMAGRNLSDAFLASALGIIRNNPEGYARVYGLVMEDPRIEAMGAIQERERFSDIENPEIVDRSLSISDRATLAASIRDERLARAVRQGRLTTSDVAALFTKTEQEVKTAQAEVAQLKIEAAQAEIALTANEREIVAARKESDAARELAASIAARSKKYLDKNKEIPPVLDSQRRSIEQRRERAEARLLEANDFLAIDKKLSVSRSRLQAIETSIAQLKAAGDTPDNAMLTSRQKLRDEVRTLEAKEQVARPYKNSATLAAYLAKEQAILETREKLARAQAERAAAKKLTETRQKLMDSIMKTPSSAIRVAEAQQIVAIQQGLSAENPNQATMGKVADIRARIEIQPEYIKLVDPDKRWMGMIYGKTLREMTDEELVETSRVVESLRGIGRLAMQQRNEARIADMERLQLAVIAAVEGVPGIKQPTGTGSPEDSFVAKIGSGASSLDLSFAKRQSVAMYLDGGGNKGFNYQLLVMEEQEMQRKEAEGVERRTAAIVQAFKDAGSSPDSWYRDSFTVRGAGQNGSDVTLSKAEIIGLYLALQDEDSGQAAVFGRFFSEQEKKDFSDEELYQVGASRLAAIEESFSVITDTDRAIIEALQADAAEAGPRIAQVMADVYNQPFMKVENYFPMIREDLADRALPEQFVADVMDRTPGNRRRPKDGFTKERVKISPKDQRPIKLDVFALWMQSIQRSEHLIAYAEYARKLDAVYVNSPLVHEQIRSAAGDAGLNYITDLVAEIKNPSSLSNPAQWDKAIRWMRGNLGAAYLGYKASGVIKQLATSIWPTVPYGGPHVLKSAFDSLAHPVTFIRSVEEKSILMRTRSMDVIQDTLKNAKAKTAAGKALLAAEQIGMMGLQWADRVSVSIGWSGVYEKALIEFNGNEKKAIAKADDIIFQTQPSARGVDLAPIYRRRDPFSQSVLQFTQALNVVWNNIRWDIPAAFRIHDLKTGVGIMVSYAIAGVLMGAITEGLDDDDEGKEALKFLGWSTSQFSDSVPLIGSQVSRIATRAITGESDALMVKNAFPAVDELLNSMYSATSGDIERSAERFVRGVGYLVGAPVSGVKEAGRIVSGDFGAALGRRPKEK